MLMNYEARRRWVIRHPVQAALLVGVTWGVTTGLMWSVLFGASVAFGVVLFLAFGVLGFGPLMVRVVRRLST